MTTTEQQLFKRAESQSRKFCFAFKGHDENLQDFITFSSDEIQCVNFFLLNQACQGMKLEKKHNSTPKKIRFSFEN